MLSIRTEESGDADRIRALHQGAFSGDAEAQLVDDLRAEGFTRLSLVAQAEDAVVGHILFSPLPIESERGVVNALALAPVAVAAAYQRQGIGSALIREGLRLAAAQGYQAVVVLGDPAYYGRFGFSVSLAEAIVSPYSGPYLMALELQPGALKGAGGQVHYPSPFAKL